MVSVAVDSGNRHRYITMDVTDSTSSLIANFHGD